MNKIYFKSEIFDVFENVRELFNKYYNGKANYSESDLYEISYLIAKMEENIKNIKEELREEIGD